MRFVKVALVGLLVVVLIAVAGGLGALAWITGRALPQTAGSVQVPGLGAEVTVARDINGIAQITATTPGDLFFAQGYVHASERMWQMEVWRHISAGRLSELFGESQLETDRFIRTVGWRAAAERDLGAVSPAGRIALDGYAAGVNAWLDTHRGSLGLAYLVTGTEPEPWTPLDTLTGGKVQAWNLGGNMDTEIFRFLAVSRAHPDPLDAEFQPLNVTELFSVTNLPSYRLLIDMSDLDDARVVITTGQAGNPFDRHYTDQIDPWRRGDTLPLPFTRSAIDEATVATLTLTP